MAERNDETPKQKKGRVSRADPVLGDSSPKARASRLKTEVVPPSMLGRLRDQLVSGAASGEDPWSVSTPSNQGERPGGEDAEGELITTPSERTQETDPTDSSPGHNAHTSSTSSQRQDTRGYPREGLLNIDNGSTSSANTPVAELSDSEHDEPYPEALSETSHNPSPIVPPWERERHRHLSSSPHSGGEEKRQSRQKKGAVSKTRDNGPQGDHHAQKSHRSERTAIRKNSPSPAKRSSRKLVLIPVGLIGGLAIFFLLKGMFLTNREEPVVISPKPTTLVAQKLQLLPGSIFEPVTSPLTFPNLPSGLYSGIARGFLPDSDVSLTLISQDNGARVGVILGIEGWQSAVASPSADQSLTISSNGWLLKFFIKKASNDIMVGRWENRFTKEVGEWKVVPMR